MTTSRQIVLLCLAVLTATCARKGHEHVAASHTQPEQSLERTLRPYYRLRRPTHDSSDAVVLIVPGCSGFGPKHYDTEAARLVSHGFSVVNVDYVAARGLATACSSVGDTVAPIPLSTIAGDILAAAADVRRDSTIRATRVFAVGGSLGGGAALAALSQVVTGSFPLDGAAVLYPQCRGVPRWSRSVPVLILLGELDNIALASVCRGLLLGRDSAANVTVHGYPDAHHAFDADELGIITEARTMPVVAFNPMAASDAWARITSFLRR